MYRRVHQDQLRRGLADLSGTIMHTPITKELLAETPEEANVAKATARRLRRALKELPEAAMAFLVYRANLRENVWFRRRITAPFHLTTPGSPSSRNCAFQGLEANPQVTSRRLFRGKVQHIPNLRRRQKSAHGHQTFRESYCCQQGLQFPDELEVRCLH